MLCIRAFAEIPVETRMVAEAAFPKGNFSIDKNTIADVITYEVVRLRQDGPSYPKLS